MGTHINIKWQDCKQIKEIKKINYFVVLSGSCSLEQFRSYAENCYKTVILKKSTQSENEYQD